MPGKRLGRIRGIPHRGALPMMVKGRMPYLIAGLPGTQLGDSRSAPRGKVLVDSRGKTKYNLPMNRGTYSYSFRFWYPPT